MKLKEIILQKYDVLQILPFLEHKIGGDLFSHPHYDSDALLLKKLNQIECSTFNGGTYYTEITSKMAEIFNALEVPAPDDEVSNGTTATDLDEELSTVDDLIDNEPDYDVKDDIDSLQ